MLFTAYHSVNLLIFAVAVVFAAIRVFELQNRRLFTFGYLSLGAWILWVLQYAILVAASFISLPGGLFLNTALGLGIIQNALWASAVLSVHFKQFSRMWLTLPLLGMFSVFVAAVAYRTKILTSEQTSEIDAVSAATFFIVLAISIVQLRLSKVSAVLFLIHGYSQWIWRWLWLTTLGTSLFVQVAVPLWRIALLVAWIRLISEMVQKAQPSVQKFDSGVKRPNAPISSVN